VPPQEPGLDIMGLARAAVAGDERALDLFSSWRPKTGKRGGLGGESGQENLNFYCGSLAGVIYYLGENGSCMEGLQADGAIRRMLYHEGADSLVVVTESLVVGQFRVEPDGSLVESSKVKMSTRSSDCSMTWAGRGLLAITTGELAVRMWNLDTGDNFVLTGSTGASGNSEFLSSLAFCAAKSTLAAGTNLGNILLWHHRDMLPAEGGSQEAAWSPEPLARVGLAVKQLSWGTN
jgi:intraflagellar transport protein 140